MTASKTLRDATKVAHQKLEQSPLGQRLARGQIPLHTYVDYLKSVAVVVTNLRTAIRRDGTREQRTLLPSLNDWVTCIEADISALAPGDHLSNPAAQAAALALTQTLFRTIADNPIWVFGFAYVIYGSHNGNRSIADTISESLDLQGDTGTLYLRATRDDGQVWQRFKELLDDNITDPGLMDAAINGANSTFDCFLQMFEALHADEERALHSSSVNPEAGSHPVPSDELVADIADRVGRQAHAAFGYLQLRYGKRGEAFARSDGAWLATLVESPEETAIKKIDWLAKLLSARGIPSVCLELHLRALHHALESSGELQGEYSDRLVRLAEHVGARRTSRIPRTDWEVIRHAACPPLDPLGMAILISAIIDQRSGLADCADSIAEWLRKTSSVDQDDRQALLSMLESLTA